jgi:hypothetical protein
MLKSSPIKKMNGAHLVLKKRCLKKKGMSTLEVWVL